MKNLSFQRDSPVQEILHPNCWCWGRVPLAWPLVEAVGLYSSRCCNWQPWWEWPPTALEKHSYTSGKKTPDTGEDVGLTPREQPLSDPTTHPAQDCRQASMVARVSGGSWELLGWSLSGGRPPIIDGQRRFRNVTHAWMKGSWGTTGLWLGSSQTRASGRISITSIRTPCSLILSVSHLSSLRYSRRDARAARSITKANGVPFSNMERDWKGDKETRQPWWISSSSRTFPLDVPWCVHGESVSPQQ